MRPLVVFALVSFSRVALAEPLPLTPIPAGDDKIVMVKEGQVAPFAGQLFDTPTAIRWANYLQQCHYRLGADVEYQKKLGDAETKALDKTLDLERAKYELVTHDLQTQLLQAESDLANPPFYRQVWFGVTIGVVASIGLMAATAAVLHAVK